MDPQQRLLLECSWEAFERSGIDPGAVEWGQVPALLLAIRRPDAGRPWNAGCPLTHDAADTIGQRAQNGCCSVYRSGAGSRSPAGTRRFRIRSAAAFASGPVFPTGPTHPGQPLSHSQSAIKRCVFASSSSCIWNNGTLKPIPPG